MSSQDLPIADFDIHNPEHQEQLRLALVHVVIDPIRTLMSTGALCFLPRINVVYDWLFRFTTGEGEPSETELSLLQNESFRETLKMAAEDTETDPTIRAINFLCTVHNYQTIW